MKILKRWLLWFLLWELLALWRKDTKLQKAVLKEQHVGNKLKLVGQALYDFNKTVIDDAKEIDLQQQWVQAKQWFDQETADLQTKVQGREIDLKNLSQEQIQTAIKEMEARYQVLLWKSKTRVKQLQETPEIADKIAAVQKAIAHIKQSIKTK